MAVWSDAVAGAPRAAADAVQWPSRASDQRPPQVVARTWLTSRPRASCTLGMGGSGAFAAAPSTATPSAALCLRAWAGSGTSGTTAAPPMSNCRLLQCWLPGRALLVAWCFMHSSCLL